MLSNGSYWIPLPHTPILFFNMGGHEARIACWCRARLVIERLRDGILAGEFSSPELTLCADTYLVSVPPHATAVAHKRPWSLCQKCRWQVTPKHPWPNEVRVKISSHTVLLFPLFRPRSVHGGWASRDYCEQAFPDKLHVSLFLWEIPTLRLTA